MNRVVLLGDSIFDNQSYVGPGGKPVIAWLRHELPPDWTASLLALDGGCIEDIPRQLAQLPRDASHLVVSVGGNDALGESHFLAEPVRSTREAISELAEIKARFNRAYARML